MKWLLFTGLMIFGITLIYQGWTKTKEQHLSDREAGARFADMPFWVYKVLHIAAGVLFVFMAIIAVTHPDS